MENTDIFKLSQHVALVLSVRSWFCWLFWLLDNQWREHPCPSKRSSVITVHVTLINITVSFLVTEELCLPDIESREALIDRFKTCVKKAQDRILWLSKEEIDRQVAERYSKYLGYPMVDIHFKLQTAMSQEQSCDNDGE